MSAPSCRSRSGCGGRRTCAGARRAWNVKLPSVACGTGDSSLPPAGTATARRMRSATRAAPVNGSRPRGSGPRVGLCITQGMRREGERCRSFPLQADGERASPGCAVSKAGAGARASVDAPERCPAGFFCAEDRAVCLPTCEGPGCPAAQQCIRLNNRAARRTGPRAWWCTGELPASPSCSEGREMPGVRRAAPSGRGVDGVPPALRRGPAPVSPRDSSASTGILPPALRPPGARQMWLGVEVRPIRPGRALGVPGRTGRVPPMTSREEARAPGAPSGHVSVVRLPHSWFILCASRELGHKPLARTLPGLPLVLFRTEGGRGRGPRGPLPAPQRAAVARARARRAARVRATTAGASTRAASAAPSPASWASPAPAGALRRLARRPASRTASSGCTPPPASSPTSEPYRFPLLDERGYTTVRRDLRGRRHRCTPRWRTRSTCPTPPSSTAASSAPRRRRTTSTSSCAAARTSVEAEYIGEPAPDGPRRPAALAPRAAWCSTSTASCCPPSPRWSTGSARTATCSSPPR